MACGNQRSCLCWKQGIFVPRVQGAHALLKSYRTIKSRPQHPLLERRLLSKPRWACQAFSGVGSLHTDYGVFSYPPQYFHFSEKCPSSASISLINLSSRPASSLSSPGFSPMLSPPLNSLLGQPLCSPPSPLPLLMQKQSSVFSKADPSGVPLIL